MNDGNEKSRKRQRKQELIEEASSKGSYLWSDKDLHNALLWFYNDNGVDGDNAISDGRGGGGNEIHSLIGALLHSPGIVHDRQMMNGRTRNRGEVKHGPLLPQIIMQYIRHVHVHANRKESKEIAVTDTNNSTEWLQSTLCDVAANRSMTEEAYHRHQILHDRIVSEQSKDDSLSKAHQRIWNYFANPKTFMKTAYAAQLYARYLELAKETQHETQKDHDEGSNNLHPNANSFLSKIAALSTLQTEIAEIFLLTTIEPIKRRYPPDHNWLNVILNDCDSDISDTIERRAFHHLSNSVLNIISEANVHSLHPSLLCILAKIYFPFAKLFIESLISCAIKSFNSIPNYIAHQAMGHTSHAHEKDDEDASRNSAKEQDPRRIFDACIETLTQLKETSDGIASLYRDIIQSSFLKHGKDRDMRALEEIAHLFPNR